MEYSKDQKTFYDKFINGENIFLTGKAGTGKSFIVQEAISEFKRQKKKVIALAPTGIAAYNIDGQTLHSMFGLPVNGVITFEECRFLKTEKRKILKTADTIVIDEVSMLRPDILDALDWTLKKNGLKGLLTKQIVFVGDLKQLPAPINDNMKSVLLQNYDGIEYFHSRIYQELKVETIELNFVHRQSDPEFIENLNIVRDGGKSPYFKKFVTEKSKGVVLAPHNTTVKKYNIEGLESITSKKHKYIATIYGNVKAMDFNLEEKLELKDGCKIMYLVNSKNNPLFNGTIGVFRYDKKKKLPFIEVDGQRWLIEQKEFEKKKYIFNSDSNELELQKVGSIKQLPVKLAYALTIHKSQGLTFDEITVDLSKPCFQKGQLYTALSRVKTPEGLNIKV